MLVLPIVHRLPSCLVWSYDSIRATYCQPLFSNFFQLFFKIALSRWNFNEKILHAEPLGAPEAGEIGRKRPSLLYMKGVQPTALYMEESTAHPSRCDPENRETRPDRSRRLGGGESSQNLNRPYIHIEESTRPNTRAVLHRPPERKPEPHGYTQEETRGGWKGGERVKRHQTNHKPRHQTLFMQRATRQPPEVVHIM